ncbi:MAG: putative CK1/CK1/CK1-D protein kinase [Streblomastix strix]|uniref:Putative CK1/CK1/CK1-D protein kinase n=1 Tax=Streblomastix strix TaxID=222440 RepID=A0A5J4UZJ9_9EUKA|nr:MAG: putative CK1/CK1/CK1-D protein kinase [Streblomastix strix]
MTGTIRYASLNAHRGYEQSRRDDLEAIGYMLIFFLTGNLPWQGLKIEGKSAKFKAIMNLKASTPIDVLCRNCPIEFVHYLNYVKRLEFAQEPDYFYLKRTFSTLFLKQRFTNDFMFDWVSQNEREQFNERARRKKLEIQQQKQLQLEDIIQLQIKQQNQELADKQRKKMEQQQQMLIQQQEQMLQQQQRLKDEQSEILKNIKEKQKQSEQSNSEDEQDENEQNQDDQDEENEKDADRDWNMINKKLTELNEQQNEGEKLPIATATFPLQQRNKQNSSQQMQMQLQLVPRYQIVSITPFKSPYNDDKEINKQQDQKIQGQTTQQLGIGNITDTSDKANDSFHKKSQNSAKHPFFDSPSNSTSNSPTPSPSTSQQGTNAAFTSSPPPEQSPQNSSNNNYNNNNYNNNQYDQQGMSGEVYASQNSSTVLSSDPPSTSIPNSGPINTSRTRIGSNQSQQHSQSQTQIAPQQQAMTSRQKSSNKHSKSPLHHHKQQNLTSQTLITSQQSQSIQFITKAKKPLSLSQPNIVQLQHPSASQPQTSPISNSQQVFQPSSHNQLMIAHDQSPLPVVLSRHVHSMHSNMNNQLQYPIQSMGTSSGQVAQLAGASAWAGITRITSPNYLIKGNSNSSPIKQSQPEKQKQQRSAGVLQAQPRSSGSKAVTDINGGTYVILSRNSNFINFNNLETNTAQIGRMNNTSQFAQQQGSNILGSAARQVAKETSEQQSTQRKNSQQNQLSPQLNSVPLNQQNAKK